MSSPGIDLRRSRASAAWGLTDELVLIAAGNPIGIPGGADQTFPYKPHPQYRWLTDCRREGGVIAFDPKDGWTHFEPPVSEHELVWGGGEPPVGRPIGELEAWLKDREGRPVANLGCPYVTVASDEELNGRLRPLLDHARRPKDESEIDLLRRSAAVTAVGYRVLREFIRPGRTEREIQVEFESAIARAGASAPGYATIVGTGPNTAVFHFVPGNRKVQEGEFVLVDAGAEMDSYVTDVTRTFPADGRFSADQKWLYEGVKKALAVGTAACRVGVEWLDVHRDAALSLAGTLGEAGILKCSPEEAVAGKVIGLFFPHGIGHMVGLGVRDAGGPLPGRHGDRTVGGSSIRMDLPLEAGYTVTVEPGLYFVPALLNDEMRRARFSDQVNWAEVDPWIGRGGVRLEDNVLVTQHGPIVLTDAIPK